MTEQLGDTFKVHCSQDLPFSALADRYRSLPQGVSDSIASTFQPEVRFPEHIS